MPSLLSDNVICSLKIYFIAGNLKTWSEIKYMDILMRSEAGWCECNIIYQAIIKIFIICKLSKLSLLSKLLTDLDSLPKHFPAFHNVSRLRILGFCGQF